MSAFRSPSRVNWSSVRVHFTETNIRKWADEAKMSSHSLLKDANQQLTRHSKVLIGLLLFLNLIMPIYWIYTPEAKVSFIGIQLSSTHLAMVNEPLTSGIVCRTKQHFF